MAGFGGGNNTTEIKVTADTSQFKSEMNLAQKAFKAFTDGVKDGVAVQKQQQVELQKTAESAKAAASGFSKFQASIVTLNASLSLFSRAANAAGDSLRKMGEVEGVTQSFKTLQASVGEFADETISGLRTATRGLVSDVDLMQKANQALLLGLPVEGFDQMAAAAIKLGRAMGIDALKSIDSLTIGVGRQSKQILDNLGVLVGVEEANQKYAASNKILGRELTDNEKKLAFQQLAFQRISEKAAQAADINDTAATSFTQLSVAVENAKNEFFASLNTNQELIQSLKELVEVVKDFDPTPIVNGITAIVGAMNTAISKTREFLNALSEAGQAQNRAPGGVGAGIDQKLNRVTDLLAAGTKESVLQAEAELKKFGEVMNRVGDSFSGKQVQETFIKPYENLVLQLKEVKKQLGIVDDQQNKNTKTNTKAKKPVEDLGVNYKELAKKAKEAAREQKKAADELNRFAQQSANSLDTSTNPKFFFDIQEAFGKFGDTPNRLVEELKKIGAEAQKAGVELSSLTPTVRDFQKIIADGGFGPGNVAGEAEARDQQLRGTRTGGGINLAELFNSATSGTTSTTGGFFGFDLGDSFGSFDFQAQIADQFAGVFQGAIEDAVSGNGFNKEEIGAAIGTAVGAAIGAAFGAPVIGAAIGGFVGKLGGQVAEELGKPTGGSAARKQADAFFADIFDADRLSVIVGDEVKRINDLVFNSSGGGKNGAIGAAAGAALGFVTGGLAAGVGSQFGRAGPDAFAQGTFGAYLDSLPEQSRRAFNAVGAGFEQLLGVSEEISGQIGAVIANNIGGSLENLQVFIQSTGKSFEELGDAMFQSFFNGNLSLGELQANLVALQDLFTAGIPGAVGAVEQAAENFNAALADGKGSRILFDSLKDIGAEAREVGGNLQSVADAVAKAMGIGADKVTLLLQAMKIAGIASVDELVNASNAKLAALALNFQQVLQGQAPTNAPVTDPTANVTAATNFSDAKINSSASQASSGASKAASDAKKKEDERKRSLRSLASEVYRVFTASKDYLDITEQLTKGTLSNKEAQQQLEDLYKSSKQAVQDLNAAQAKYDKAAEKNAKPGVLSKLAAEIKKFQDVVDGLKKTTVDLSFLKTFENDLNLLGLSANTAGASLEDTKQKIINLYKAGKLSAEDANRELKKTEDIFSSGIPGAVGAVDQAFKNFVEAGKNGGAFGIDAFKDILAEAKEAFVQRQSPQRLSDFQKLTKDFNEARDAVQKGINTGKTQDEITKLQERFDDAKTALDSFNAALPEIGFENLRSILSETQSPDQIEALFKAIGQSGLTTFEDLQNAGDDAIIGITASFQQNGGVLDATSERINEINLQLNKLIEPKVGKITFDVSLNAVNAVTQSILDKIGTGGVETTINPSTNGGSNTPSGGGGGRKTSAKTPKVGSIVRSAKNPGKGYTYVSQGLYRYTG